MHIFCAICVLRVNTGREYEQDGKKEMIFTLKLESFYICMKVIFSAYKYNTSLV